MENERKNVNYSAQEWLEKGQELFGDDYSNWKFVCPKCGNTASGAEFESAGAELNDIYTNCIGRFIKGKGCDWTSFGLFDICTVHVDGMPVFDFGIGEGENNG